MREVSAVRVQHIICGKIFSLSLFKLSFQNNECTVLFTTVCRVIHKTFHF